MLSRIYDTCNIYKRRGDVGILGVGMKKQFLGTVFSLTRGSLQNQLLCVPISMPTPASNIFIRNLEYDS